MIALLAVCPIRIKNFAALEFGRTFSRSRETGGRPCRMAPPRPMLQTIDRCRTISDAQWTFIVTESRPVLIGSRQATNSLWISSRTGRRYTTKNLGTQISKITLETIRG